MDGGDEEEEEEEEEEVVVVVVGCSSCRKRERRVGEWESERKSLEEKSMEVAGVMVSFRRAERAWRRVRVARRVVRRGVGRGGGGGGGGAMVSAGRGQVSCRNERGIGEGNSLRGVANGSPEPIGNVDGQHRLRQGLW